MKLRRYTVLSLLTATLSLGGSIGSTGLFAQTPVRSQSRVATYKNGIRQGQILVKFKEGETSLNEVKRAAAHSAMIRTKGATPEVISFESMPKVSRIAKQINAVEITPVFDMNPRFEKRFKKEGLDRWFAIDFDSSDDPIAVMEALKSTGEVQVADLSAEIVQPTYKSRPIYVPSLSALSKSSGIVSDPMFDQQWHYHNTGQTNGTPGSDINLVRAWEKRMNAEEIIVAVMDQGVDHQHEDIRANMWVNEAELYGRAGVDDDGNGQIDDIYGFDFGMGYGSIEKGEHGTHVAGTVAAVTNNGIGVAGVAGGDGSGNGARIMTLPVFGENNDRAANSFIYAADMGALISQNSWGFSSPGFESEIWRDAIRYFVKYAGCDENGDQLPGSKMKGGLVIFAAGNDASSGQYFPSCLDEVIGVASLNHISKPAFYTNYDSWVDVACYGGETSPRTEGGVLSTLPNNRYGFMDGTSMACPHVSGIACLALAELGGNGFTRDMLFNYITLTTRKNEANYEPMYQNMMGSGIVDAVNAMTKNDGVPPIKIESVIGTNFADTYFRIMFDAPSKEDGSKVEGYNVYLKNLATQESRVITFGSTLYPNEREMLLLSGLTPETTYEVSVTAYDIWLTESPESDKITVTTAKEKGSIGATQTLFKRDIDVDKSSSISYDLTIRNSGQGALSWRADAYSHLYSRGYEVFSLDNAVNGLVRMEMARNIDDKTQVAQMYKSMGFKKLITYRATAYPTMFIGEVREQGKSMPASAAIKFNVPDDMEEGFTLTHFDIGLNTSNYWLYDDQVNAEKELPIRIEIYRGGDLPRVSNRIYHSSFIRPNNYPLEIYILPFKPYFEAGESFWIVVHTQAGMKYPIGITNDATETGHSFYSTDFGQTWETAERAMPGYTPSFVMSALSMKDYPKPAMKIEPATGYLNPGESKSLSVTIDATDIAEGIDSTHIVLSTDGTSVSGRTFITSVLNVYRSDIDPYFTKDLYNYSTVSLGDESDMTISFYNKGMAHMSFDSIVLSNNESFSFASKSLPKVLYSKDSINIDVRFKPTTLGAANSLLKFYGNNRVDSVLLLGTCVEPPKASFNELVIDVPIKGNNKFIYNVKIANSSNYSLNYNFSDFIEVERPMPDFDLWNSDNKTLDDLYADSTDLYTGYKWVDNNRGVNYQGTPFVDISSTGTELTNKVDFLSKNTKVRLPFAFPYYDRQVRDLWVGVNGVLVLDSADFSAFNVPTILPDYQSKQNGRDFAYKGIIAPLWMADGSSGNFSTTRFFYQVMEDCVIFQFQGTKVYMIDSDKPSTYQAVLYPNGEIEFRYKETFEVSNMTSNTFMVGWASPDGLDGGTIWYIFREFGTIANSGNYCIKITPPILYPFSRVDQVSYKGIINPMSSKEIPVSIDPSLILPGESSHKIIVETNDPENKMVELLFNFNKEDIPNFQFEQTSVDFGELEYKGLIERELNIFNATQSAAPVRLSFAKDGDVTYSNSAKELTLNVPANTTAKFKVYLSGAIDNKIVAKSVDGNSIYAELSIKSSKVLFDNIELDNVDKKSLSYELEAGEIKSDTIRISSDAKKYSSNLFLPGFISAEIISSSNSRSSSTRVDGNGYRWYNSASPEAPQFIWNDISKTGEKLLLEPNLDNPPIKLPFQYKLYDTYSDVIYVAPSGRISYLPQPWDVFSSYIPPRRMPNSDLEYPFISAMWSRQWYSPENKEAGVFYDVNDERCIIQFHMFQYDWVITNGYTSYQIIVYKDGTIQFVYLDPETCDLKDHITIGVQGEGGSSTKGYTYSLNSSTKIKNKTTITAKPMSGPYRVEAGETIDIKLTANSYGFKAGNYLDSIYFVSENNQLTTKLPVSISVSSNAKLQLKDDEIDFGDVVCGEEVESKLINLINTGNQDLIISDISYSNGTESLFALKVRDVVLEQGQFIDTYVDVKLPITIPVYGSELYYLFFTPEYENKKYDVDMEFITTNGDSNDKLNIKAQSFKPARLSVLSKSGDSELNVDLLNTTGSIYDKIKVSYDEGENNVDYRLGYEVVNPLIGSKTNMRFTSPNVKAEDISRPIYLQSKMFNKETLQSVKQTPISSESMLPYRSISIIGDNPPEAMIGTAEFGDYYGLSAFVKMTTGDAGFLMSHVKMWTNTIGRDTGYVEIRIYDDCKLPSPEYILYDKAHRFKMDVSLVGELTLPLEHDIAFAPNQEFWVEVYFGIKLQMPIAVASRPESMTESRNYYRFYDAKKEEWNPLYEYPNSLFAIWAVQESYSDLSRWFTVPNEDYQIGPSEIVESDIRMNRLHIPMGGSTLKVNAVSKQLTTVEPLTLEVHKYKEPEWTHLPTKTMVIREGSEIEFFVKAVDDEDLPIDYSLKSPVEGVSLHPQDGGVKVIYKAPYTAGYVTNLNIEARTTKGISVRRVSIGNVNVNRAPVAGVIKPINISLDPMNTAVVFSPYFFFVDPDGDYLQYSASISGSNIALNLSQNGFVFTPLEVGTSEIILTASDGEFQVSNRFTVNVIKPLVYAPVLTSPIPNRTVNTGEGFTVDLSNHFYDYGGYELTYDAWSTDENIGVVSVSGSTVSVMSKNPGIAAVGVRAVNSEGGETTSSFAFRAVGAAVESEASSNKSTLTISPNPSKGLSVVSFNSENLESGDYFFEIRDLAGKRIRTERLNSISETDYIASLNVNGIQSGVYILSVFKDGILMATERLVVVE